ASSSAMSISVPVRRLTTQYCNLAPPTMAAPASTEELEIKTMNGSIAPDHGAATADPAARLAAIRARIETACRNAGRLGHAVTLLAVSKTFPAETVLGLAELGQRAFGENYLQEGLAKIAA